MAWQRVLTFFESWGKSKEKWMHPFNQVAFLNYDINFSVTINRDFKIPPAQPLTNGVIPGKLSIGLNVGEVNDTYFDIQFNAASTTNSIVIIHTEYAT
jgi:hypothetical protein